jgi:CarD family transcriptional regulator, regulator of rRNA transcription
LPPEGSASAQRASARPPGLTVLEIWVTIYHMKSARKPTRHAPTKYKVGQEIVYPLQGVGHIRAIEERPFRDKKLLYYIVYLEVSDMTIMVPVDKADELGIRAIVGKKESLKALRLIAEEFEPIPADWKLRYQMNLDLLKKGSIIDIANVVRALYHRSRIKELPILERKLYDSALKLLIDEISFSLLKSKEEVEELVFAKLKVNVK